MATGGAQWRTTKGGKRIAVTKDGKILGSHPGVKVEELVGGQGQGEPTDSQRRIAFTTIYRAYQSGRLNDQTHRYFGRLVDEDRIEEASSFAARVWRESSSDDSYTLRETANAIGKREHPLPKAKPKKQVSPQRRQTEREFVASMRKQGVPASVARENYRRKLPPPEEASKPAGIPKVLGDKERKELREAVSALSGLGLGLR